MEDRMPIARTLATAGALAAITLAASAARADDKPLSDAQIATVALTAHQIDVERGKLAVARTKNDAVKQLAQHMVDDHTLGANEVLALAKKLGVTPEESAVSKSLKDGAAQTAAKLKGLKGAKLDRAYVEAEIAYHQAVIDAVNRVLIPGANNPEVKQALVNTGPTLQGHLVHAQQVQALLAKQKEKEQKPQK
jgi:putative membrane protein